MMYLLMCLLMCLLMYFTYVAEILNKCFFLNKEVLGVCFEHVIFVQMEFQNFKFCVRLISTPVAYNEV
jgi:hypothetical protein